MFPFPFLPPYKVHATYVRSAIAMYIRAKYAVLNLGEMYRRGFPH